MVEYLKKGDEIRAGELTVSVLHPGAGEDYTGEENAGSVVLQLSCGACRALLTEIWREAEKKRSWGRQSGARF